MTIAVDVDKRAGEFSLSVKFESDGRITALFGRSGAGKTTLVNLIAGLMQPDRGRIAVNDTVLVDTARGIAVPTHKRGIGYVFQEGRLFPHLSVRGNLGYGRRFARERSGPPLDEIAALLGIGALLDRRPADLSGGEKQRVAIGRALLANPHLLLMDEPLASLDRERKAEILPYIERLRDEMNLPIVYVSHAVEEVARLADTVVVLADGKVAASGPTGDIFARLDLGDAVDRDMTGGILTARVVSHDTATGTTRLDHPAGPIFHPLLDAPPDATVRLRVRARDVAIAVGEPGQISIRNRLAATVTEIASGRDHAVDVKLDVGGEALVALITHGALSALDLKVGRPVVALIKSTAFDRPEDS
ncbi:MAG: molybdenum ABC transporter ATP-binding protein [Bauldia sp.]